MSELWSQGLLVSVVGLAVTFAALGLLIGLMALLTRLFPAEAAVVETAVSTPTSPPQPFPTAEPDNAAIAAAIATALTLARREQDQQLGHGLETDRSPWWYKDKARNRVQR